MGIATILKLTAGAIGKYAPQILTGLGIAGFVTATVMAVEVTPEAYNKIKSEEYKRTVDGDDTPVTIKDVIKLTWKDYTPPVAMTVISGAMIVTGHTMLLKRHAKQIVALTTAYAAVSDQANKYYEKTKQLVGKTKAEDVKTEVAKDLVEAKDDTEFELAPSINGGTDYFLDALSGRIFKYDIRMWEKAVNKFDHELMTDMWKPVNELYDLVGLDHVVFGDILGYDVDDGLLDYGKPNVVEHNGKAVFVLMPNRNPVTRQNYRYM